MLSQEAVSTARLKIKQPFMTSVERLEAVQFNHESANVNSGLKQREKRYK